MIYLVIISAPRNVLFVSITYIFKAPKSRSMPSEPMLQMGLMRSKKVPLNMRKVAQNNEDFLKVRKATDQIVYVSVVHDLPRWHRVFTPLQVEVSSQLVCRYCDVGVLS